MPRHQAAKRSAAPKRVLVLGGVAFLLAMLFLSVLFQRGDHAVDADVSQLRSRAYLAENKVDDLRNVNRDSTVEVNPAAAERQNLDDGLDPPVSLASDSLASGESRRILENLETAIEASVYQSLDPEPILAAAELLFDLDVDKRAIPEPDPTGDMRFPLLNPPEGVSAELRLVYSESHANVLALQMRVDAPPEPFYLEGVLRAELSSRLQIWADDEGQVLDFVIQTTVQPHYRESMNQGIPYRSGTIIEGIYLHTRMGEVPESSMKAIGMQDGVYTTWEIPLALEASPWPPVDRIKLFSDKLMALRNKVR